MTNLVKHKNSSATAIVFRRINEYESAFADEIYELENDGYSLAHLCCHFRVSRRTLDSWMKTYPDFAEAVDYFKQESQVWWENLVRTYGVEKNNGVRLNAALVRFTMSHLFTDYETKPLHLPAVPLITPENDPAMPNSLLDKLTEIEQKLRLR